MSVQDSLEFDPAIAPARGAADTSPAPSWWDAAKANWRLAEDDDEAHNANNRISAYNDLEDALVAMGRPRSRYRNDDWGSYWQPVETAPERFDQLWNDVAAARAANPAAFKDLPADRAKFDTWAYARKGGRAADTATSAAGGFGSQIVPSLGVGLTQMAEPLNLAQISLGGGASSISGLLARQFGAGVLGTALMTPTTVRARANMGEGYTSNEMARDLAIGGLANAAFVGAATLGPKVLAHVDARLYDAAAPVRGKVDAAIDPMFRERDLARAFRKSVEGDWAMTPQQAAALHVVERGAEVDATNPFPHTHEAIDAHAAKLETLIADMAEQPRAAMPPPPPSAAPAPHAAARPAGGSGGSIDGTIAGYFTGRGYSPAQARGIAAGIHAESGSNPFVVNSSSGAYGIGQWLGPRLRELRRRYGQRPNLQQQLEFLDWELRGGDAGGKHVLAAGDEAGALQAYITRFMRPAAGMETNGDIARGMAALGRPDERPAGLGDDVGGGADPALAVRPDALDAARPQISAGGREIPIGSFAPSDIGVDAGLMQFKAGGDAAGVTDRLRGIDQWDPLAAGMVTVWEANDGRRLIADGHQRHGLASRLQAAGGGQDIRLNAFVLREADGVTAADARVATALKNIGEGTGTATDAAKVFRDVGLDPDVLRRLPPRSTLVRDGKALARLSDEAFGAVVNEVIPESHGAAIGHLAQDPDTHVALVDLLGQLDPPNRRQAEAIVRQALDAGFRGEKQDELFGTRDLVSALFAHKAKALDRTLGELRKLKGAFSVAARNAEALDAAGNTIDVAASEAAARGNAEALDLVEALALRKGNAVNDAFNRAAQRLADGEPIGRVTRDVVAELRTLDLQRALRDVDGLVDPAVGSGRGELAGDEAGPLSGEDSLTPATIDELEAAGQGGFAMFDDDAGKLFDDPDGAAVAKVADTVWHDVRMAQDARSSRNAEPTSVGEVIPLDALLDRATANQRDLVAFGDERAGAGVEFVDPGVKSAARIREKVELEGYGDVAELGDITRGAFVLDDPAHADDLIAALLQRFPGSIDKGWKLLPDTGYFDRKISIEFPGGGRGEMQLVPRSLWDVKKAGGNELYKQSRSPIDVAERTRLTAQQRDLYAAALAGSPFEGIAVKSAEGNRSANTAGVSRSPSSEDLSTSPGASRQVPLDQAQARPVDPETSTATGRSSTSNNSSFMDDPSHSRDAAADSAKPAQMQGREPARFDLDDGKGERTIDEIAAELDDDARAIDTIEACLAPPKGGLP